MPAWEFGHQKKCWKNGGRKKCIKDQTYKNIESDLYNLQPAIGEINGDRSNFMYDELKKQTPKYYGKCKMKIDFKRKLIEPPNRARGAIARTYFYMSERYKIILSQKQKKIFNKWDKIFPVTKWECKREQLIFKAQGYHNNYVYKKCLLKKQ